MGIVEKKDELNMHFALMEKSFPLWENHKERDRLELEVMGLYFCSTAYQLYGFKQFTNQF